MYSSYHPKMSPRKYRFKLNNQIFIVFSLLVLGVFSFYAQGVFGVIDSGGGGGGNVSLFLYIENPTIFVGNSVAGTATVKIYGEKALSCNTTVNFGERSGDTKNMLSFNCEYNPQENAGSKFTECSQTFSYLYKDEGEYKIHMKTDCGTTSYERFHTVKVIARPTTGISGIESPIQSTTIEELLERIGTILQNIIIALGIFVLIIAGYYFMAAGTNPRYVLKAKRIIVWVFVALGIAILAKGIIFFITHMFSSSS